MTSARAARALATAAALVAVACGGSGESTGVQVQVRPASAEVLAGEVAQFTAEVTGTTRLEVDWAVSGSGCAGSACGTVSDTGLYAAPLLPPGANLAMAVRATSRADPSRAGAAQVAVPAVAVSVAPTATDVALGSSRQLAAAVTGTRNQGVAWTLSGPGSLSATGLYRAPDALATPASATATAASAVAPARTASATIHIPAVSVAVAPATATVLVDGTKGFSVSVSHAADARVDWSVVCAAACGSIDAAGLYTPPPSVDQPLSVEVRAVSRADPTKSSSALVTVPPVGVAVTPEAAAVTLGATRRFTAAVTNAVSGAVSWSVAGPGTIDTARLYAAPPSHATPATVTVIATSAADPSRSASAVLTIPAVSVSVSPASQTVIAGATRQFAAAVTTATDTAATWSVAGPGTIDAAGLYAAPASLATPASATVTATSRADPGKSASTTVSIPAVGVALAPTTATVILGATRPFTTAVTNAIDTGVIWAVTGTGCTGSGCGAVSAGGLFTAPGRFTTPATLTVTARARADPGKSASASVTLPEVSVAIYPTATKMAPARTRRHVATVTNATDTSVGWSVSGVGCSAPCGAVDPAGMYASPAAPPDPALVTVTATSTADPTKSASSPVTVSLDPNARLSGEFAFLLRGSDYVYDPLAPYQAAGSFVADGDGHVRSGVRDLVGSGTAIVDDAFTGSYSVEADDQGSLDFNPGRSYRFSLRASGDGGFIIDYNPVPYWLLSGILLRQDPLDFAAGRVAGDFVGALEGAAPGRPRLGAVGRFHADGAGNASAVSFDVNDGAGTQSVAAATGSYDVGPGGRGSAVLGIPGSTQAFPMSLYVVDGERLLLVSRAHLSTGTPMLSGLMVRQSGGPFTSDSLGAAGIFALQGRFSDAYPSVAIGRLVPDGAGGLSGVFDRNENGTFTASAPLSGTYQVAPDGRGTIASNLGQLVFYLARPGEAFLLEAPGSLVRTGRLRPQSGGPFSGASLAGRFHYGSLPPATSSTIAIVGSEVLQEGTSAATFYVKSAAGPQFGMGTAGYTIESSGRGVVVDPGNAVFWVISPDAFVQIHDAPLTPSHSIVYVLER